MATVYKIENPKGDCYIGSTSRPNMIARKAEHKYAAKTGRKGLVYDSIRKYGFDNHTITILGKCSEEDVIELEHFIIKETQPSLNITQDHNATAVGKIWVTNGEIEFQIEQDVLMPYGFRRGRKPNSKLGRRKQ